jgi:anti-sigma regulatory factor (Ser/Thr protein kinase)
MELYLERFEVPSLVEEIAAVVQPLAARKGNTLATRCEPGAGDMYADQTKVRQALFNLLSNACKFTERGTVSLSARRERLPDHDAPWMVFEVSDTGIGMTEEQMGRLFQEFSQAEASTSRKYGGTGLGLALSRRLCQMMGGDISLESEVGRGSTFTIRLPAEVSAAAAPPEATEATAAEARATSPAAVMTVDRLTSGTSVPICDPSGIDGETGGAGGGGEPCVKRRQRCRTRRRGERQVQRIGGAQWGTGQGQEEVLGPAMDVAGQLDPVVDVLVETSQDGVLKASRNVLGERALPQTTRHGGDDFGHGQVRHEHVVPTLHNRVELVAA